MTRLSSALAAPLTALLVLATSLGATTLAATAAVPAEGSVPSEVAAYVADGSLVAQLDDVYGVDEGGDGIEFDETTTTGVIERVHHFSVELSAGEDTEFPLVLVNEWIVPISIAEKPVGLATLWINPASVRPELASFVADAELATALSAVPDGASLVHDESHAAWLVLADDGMLTPVVPGTTDLTTPVPIDLVTPMPAEGDSGATGGDPATGVGFAIAVILVLLAIIIVALVLPSLRKKKPVDADAEPGDEGGSADAGEPDDEPAEVEPTEVEPTKVEPAVLDLGEVDAVVIDKPKKPRKPRKPPASTESTPSE